MVPSFFLATMSGDASATSGVAVDCSLYNPPGVTVDVARGVATITLASNCSIHSVYYFASYSAQSNNPIGWEPADYPQYLYAVTTWSNPAGSQISVPLPSSCWQLDLVWGPRPAPVVPSTLTWSLTAGGSTGYQIKNFVWGYNGPEGECTPGTTTTTTTTTPTSTTTSTTTPTSTTTTTTPTSTT
ncbi:MAG TPA: hypothetical protein VFN61_08280, partial [Acidimicrobiales bacterium]|nr:hypothetical protein [Acidimicrobiales bacterium]